MAHWKKYFHGKVESELNSAHSVYPDSLDVMNLSSPSFPLWPISHEARVSAWGRTPQLGLSELYNFVVSDLLWLPPEAVGAIGGRGLQR